MLLVVSYFLSACINLSVSALTAELLRKETVDERTDDQSVEDVHES